MKVRVLDGTGEATAVMLCDECLTGSSGYWIEITFQADLDGYIYTPWSGYCQLTISVLAVEADD